MNMTSAVVDRAPGFLRIEQLTKRFDSVAAVDGVSIDIARGEIFALLGSSGCGKSTLLRMLAGFETPTSGAMSLDGQDIVTMPPYQRPINMMFQSYALFPHLTVWENVAFGLKRDGMARHLLDERVDEMLGIVKLRPYAKRKPHQLSGGQQQRVALARALAKSPKLLLLDEPLGALDRKLREQTQFELHSIIKKVGVTCVLVTHDQEEAMTMADRIAVMSDGRFMQIGQPNEIYETPGCRFVADFIGKVNLLDGELAEDKADHCVISTPQGTIRVGHGITGTVGMKVAVALRPEKIVLRHECSADSDYNCLPGEVTDSGYYGSFSLYRVLLANGKKIQVQIVHADRHDELLKPGDQVFAGFSSDAMVVLTN
ncbi:polyamine ABC transporter ATP-binding protein [Ramlibacter monticola]|uniref:Spermidine/putrescine import ATP-binding protein PotA n=2 Tax=Ramlibacter monticola TaxID=1926872 RepID=A0A936Z2N4_9BURK|nr:polyamine ABC transporter ATP-binding protein [Ramlibacter monticola]MBL0393237.1 polyamine ABC transporter ATP-binding protein [Ramlibacter monticola]